LLHRGQFSSIQRDCKCPRHLLSLTGFTTGIPVQVQSQNSIGYRIFFLGLCNLSVTLTDNLALQNDENKGARMPLPRLGRGGLRNFGCISSMDREVESVQLHTACIFVG
jgi:hypothetical protein